MISSWPPLPLARPSARRRSRGGEDVSGAMRNSSILLHFLFIGHRCATRRARESPVRARRTTNSKKMCRERHFSRCDIAETGGGHFEMQISSSKREEKARSAAMGPAISDRNRRYENEHLRAKSGEIVGAEFFSILLRCECLMCARVCACVAIINQFNSFFSRSFASPLVVWPCAPASSALQ